MLQQGTEYMRISPISQYSLNKYQQVPVQKTFAVQNTVYKMFPSMPLNYFLSFKGYSEDKEFLEKSSELLENSIARVAQKYQFGNPEFEASLNILKKESPQIYKQLIERKELFKIYEQEFSNFNSTVIESLNQVKNNEKQYTDFWKQNSKIGNKKTIDIINEAINNQNTDINKVISKTGKKDYEKIKNALILSGYGNILSVPPKNIQVSIIEENQKNYEALVSLCGENNAKRYFDSLKNSFYEDFNKRTINKIFNEKLDNEKRLNGFNEIVSYIENSLEQDTPQKLSQNLKTISAAQNNLDKAIQKESFQYFKNDIKNLYNIAVNSWEEKELPFLLNNTLKKQIYNLNAEKKNRRIKNFQNYSGLSVEQKYFVSTYYTAKNNSYENNDLLKIMIDDRNIDNPAVIIDAMSLKIDNDRDVYFQKLDNFPELLNFLKDDRYIDIPDRVTQNPNDFFSFINMYLYVLNKLEEYQKYSDESKIEFLSSLTKEELQLASNEIKELWINEELPFAVQAEVRRQANLTSINKKMFDELVKVNLNLNDIKIKMDNFSYTLKDLLENKYIIKDPEEMEKINQNASTLVADAERKYNSMSEEQKASVDKSLQETLPLVIDNLIKNETDPKSIEELSLLKTKCKTSPKAAKDSFGLIKTILVGRAMSYGIQKGGTKVTGLFSSSKHLPGMETGMHIFNTAGSGKAAAGSSAKSGFIPVDPMTAAIVAGIALVTATVVSAKKATKLEKQQREIIVELK